MAGPTGLVPPALLERPVNKALRVDTIEKPCLKAWFERHVTVCINHSSSSGWCLFRTFCLLTTCCFRARSLSLPRGTICYLAPEVLKTIRPVTYRTMAALYAFNAQTDVFAFG